MKNKDEYITKEDAFNIAINYISPSMFDHMKNLLKEDIEEYETEYSVSKGTLEQILWERDIAIKQLEELGITFGCINETAIKKDTVKKVIEQIENEHPYKILGEYDTYSDYHQGWSDACDRILCSLLDKEDLED